MNLDTFKKLPAKQRTTVLVVIGVIILASLIIFNPSRRSNASQNTKRTQDITEILDAVHKFVEDDANSNNFPVGMPSIPGCAKATAAGDPPTGALDIGTKGAHLARTLVPHYIEKLPEDPQNGSEETTGYKICTDSATNAVTVWADTTEGKKSNTDADLHVTR